MARLAGGLLVSDVKITDYLLNADHPVGAPKAAFFNSFGFSADDPVMLSRALLMHPQDNDIVQVEASAYGIKSVVRCRMRTPDGRDPCIISVWILEAGASIQRLVTAYPAEA
jgi:hypothetical protein